MRPSSCSSKSRRFLAVESAVVVLAGLSNPALRWNRKESAMLFRELMTQLVWHRSENHRIEVFRRKNKGPGARAGHFPSFFSLFYNAKNHFFRKIHSFSKPVPLPPVRKWQTDLPETHKCAVSQTKTFTNSNNGLRIL